MNIKINFTLLVITDASSIYNPTAIIDILAKTNKLYRYMHSNLTATKHNVTHRLCTVGQSLYSKQFIS